MWRADALTQAPDAQEDGSSVIMPLRTGPARGESDGAGPSVVQDGPHSSSAKAADPRTVDPRTAPSARDADSSDDGRPSKRKRRGVSFGEVHILTHGPALDGSKVPSDGRAPMGLGPLESLDIRRMDSYDHERLAARRVRRSACSQQAPLLCGGRPSLLSARASRQGIRAIPANERTAILTTVAMHRSASIDFAEREIAENRRRAADVRQGELLMPVPSSDHETVGIVDLWD